MKQTFAEALTVAVRSAAQAYAVGDQVAPCAVLWPDPDRLWESIVPILQPILPELYSLGGYDPEKRTGPAVWLRCIEARVVAGAPAEKVTPVFYLPGVSREQLRVAEDCPPALAPLVELQYRGVTWLHANGKVWTPYSLLSSLQGGLGLEVPKDQATLEALPGALTKLMEEPISNLKGRRLDSEFFNSLVSPDAQGLVLRWLNDPLGFKQLRSAAEWKAFCEQCKAEFRLDPIKDGPLKAAKLLAERATPWGTVWLRFTEVPGSFPGIVEWLLKAAPKSATMFDTAEVWPHLNREEEQALQQGLDSLVDKPQNEAIRGVLELEQRHAIRRSYPWQKLGLNPLATAMEPLAQLAEHCKSTPGAPTAEAYAEFYSKDGWKVDAAALATLAACGSPEQHGAILKIVRAIYLPWLETTARKLQELIHKSGGIVPRRSKAPTAVAGRITLFADGLRMDVAKRLAQVLSAHGFGCTESWEWSTIPSVTASAKPAASPVSVIVQGGEASDEFCTRIAATGQTLTQDRFVAALNTLGWKALGPSDTGEPSGSGWTEAGALDKRGHNEGWKLARSVNGEVRDLVSRIESLLATGWTEVAIVTDHGWLLMPGGLPKVELKSSLAENRWGRCAALKPGAVVDVQTFKWSWNHDVSIVTPPGAGCYRASIEYSHGGVSLQEMVTPVIYIAPARASGGEARLLIAKWTGAKCRVSVEGAVAGFRVDVRTKQSDAATSLLSDRQAREITSEGTVTIFLEDDSDIGKQAEMVLLNTYGQVINSQPVTWGN